MADRSIDVPVQRLSKRFEEGTVKIVSLIKSNLMTVSMDRTASICIERAKRGGRCFET